MDEPFILPVEYKGKTLEFEAQLFTTSYNYRIQVLVDEIAFNFERDDEGNFRALAATPDDKKAQKTDPSLLQAIGNTLETILS